MRRLFSLWKAKKSHFDDLLGVLWLRATQHKEFAEYSWDLSFAGILPAYQSSSSIMRVLKLIRPTTIVVWRRRGNSITSWSSCKAWKQYISPPSQNNEKLNIMIKFLNTLSHNLISIPPKITKGQIWTSKHDVKSIWERNNYLVTPKKSARIGRFAGPLRHLVERSRNEALKESSYLVRNGEIMNGTHFIIMSYCHHIVSENKVPLN